MTTPMGWERKTLGELGRYLNGRAFKKQEWRSTGRPIIRIQNLTGSSDTFNFFEGEVDDRYVVRPGDLLVSWAATLGSYIWTGPEAVLNQHIFKVESNIDLKFHKYLLDHKLDELMRHTHGSGMVHITRGRFDAVPVDTPTLDEQRRIVDLLEDHLSRLDAASRAIENSLVRLKALRDSALLSVVADAQRIGQSETHSLGELARVSSGMTPLRGNRTFYDGGTIPWITSGDLHQGLITKPTQFVTQRALDETSLKVVPAGSLLVAMYGEGKTRGTAAELGLEATTNQACAAITLHEPDLRAWVRLILDANYTGLRRLAAGGVQPNLNLSLVKAIGVPVPPADTRRMLLSRITRIDEARERMKEELLSAQRQGTSLRRALLKAAFSGRLTGVESDLSAPDEMIGA